MMDFRENLIESTVQSGSGPEPARHHLAYKTRSENALKRIATTTAVVLALLASGCSSMPWAHELVGSEVNMAFTLENNLLYLPSLDVDGRTGRFIFASAARRSVLDPSFSPATGAHSLQISEKQTLRFSPAGIDMHGVADGIIGADAWGSHAVTIDYRSGLLTYQKEGIYPAYMSLFEFAADPEVTVIVDGRAVRAIVDTSSPDTLVLPSDDDHRTTARVSLAGTDFGAIDVRHAPVERARVGNRILSRFLVTIDYGKKVTGLWRDPRIPLRESSPSGERTSVRGSGTSVPLPVADEGRPRPD